jgi:hypothetical protein
LILASLLNFINFLLAISFYILVKSVIYLVIFRETLEVAVRKPTDIFHKIFVSMQRRRTRLKCTDQTQQEH